MNLLKFNGEMIDAILEGRKTQTRRPIKEFTFFEPHPYELGFWIVEGPEPRDLIDDEDRIIPAGTNTRWTVIDRGLDYYCPYGRKWNYINFHNKSGLPFGELFLSNVRVERLQDIKEEDAIAEGIKTGRFGNESNWRDGFYIPGNNQPYLSAKEAFKHLWISIYSEENWNANSWVWVIEFRRINNE
ncbi:hypothetical protein M5U04_16890 [Xenorhabdus sp. XENO-1]|uniref:hypothetical protein n=1 Tax=Xenorhabdus bovienii TaxID=40576 RepID=UPI0020CA925E|nr:hypothetical protein [Xenorhabdus bovienii]MCP9269713.1 hypothetical protein [Xenorhabdus bovienii subsp. africana]